MDSEPKAAAPGSPDREPGPEGAAEGDGVKGGAEETDDGKKRKRKPYRPGSLGGPHIGVCRGGVSWHP